MDNRDERIITAVQQYPALYAKSDRNYKDLGLKDNIWREISSEIHVEGMFNVIFYFIGLYV